MARWSRRTPPVRTRTRSSSRVVVGTQEWSGKVTAAAVVFSMDEWRSGTVSGSSYATIGSERAVSKEVVTVRMTPADTLLPKLLTWCTSTVYPDHDGRSLSGGGVIGQEGDDARLLAGTSGHHVPASSVDHSLIPDVLGADPVHHGDVVLSFHDHGVVFSASSTAWTGALHIDDDAETFVRNVLTRFLDPAPLARPAAGPVGP